VNFAASNNREFRHREYLHFEPRVWVQSKHFLLLLLLWRYSPGWALASITIRLQASRSLALSLHSFIPVFLRSVDTSSSHIVFGLSLRLQSRHVHTNYTSESGDVLFAPRCRFISYKSSQRVYSQGLKE
jgi:hypothetical protein